MGGGELISIGSVVLEVADAAFSSGRALMTPAREPHCCRSSAASVFSHASIQSWQCFTTLLQNMFVMDSKAASVCARASVIDRL